MNQPTEEHPDEALRRLGEEIRVWREEARRKPPGLDDLTLAAYISGELDDTARKRVEAQLAGSPDLEEVVGVVQETLERGDWQAQADEIKLDLRPPVLLAPGPLVVHRGGRRRVRIAWWLGAAAAAAAAALLALPVWWPGGPAGPPPTGVQVARQTPAHARKLEGERLAPGGARLARASALRVYKCSLDAEGQIARREAVAADRPMPANSHFQVELPAKQADGFCLLQVDSAGKVKLLHSGPTRVVTVAGKAILPSPEKAYRVGKASGAAGLVLVRTDLPGELLAKVQSSVDEIMSADATLRLSKDARGVSLPAASSPAVRAPREAPTRPSVAKAPEAPATHPAVTPGPRTRRASEPARTPPAAALEPGAQRGREDLDHVSQAGPYRSTPRSRRRLAEARVRDLLERLKKDYDVEASRVLTHEPK